MGVKQPPPALDGKRFENNFFLTARSLDSIWSHGKAVQHRRTARPLCRLSL